MGDQRRYNEITAGNRATLTSAFKRAGWRTVSDVPSDRVPWSFATSFYHYDKVYDAGNVGYTGPSFSYASMPDQFTMAALHRAEFGPGHSPVMAEIDLVSSHTPWAPLPSVISWDHAGDGAAYASMPAHGHSPDAVWQDGALVRAAYGESIRYSLQTLISYVQHYGDDNLVMLLLGDHQPATVVTGQGAGHDVPVSLIAHDPAVLARVSGWGWQQGLLPGPTAPVWPMDAFRDRFIAHLCPLTRLILRDNGFRDGVGNGGPAAVRGVKKLICPSDWARWVVARSREGRGSAKRRDEHAG